MQTKKKRNRVVAVLAGLSWALPAWTADTPPKASSYLPLAVGNSWTYHHHYSDLREGDIDFESRWPTYLDQGAYFTIRVERTEKIDGQTYFVFSEMPANWPPAPPHFLAGKKLRWAGTRLMEHSGGGEQAIFRFDATARSDYVVSADFTATQDLYEVEYAIPATAKDTRVKATAKLKPPKYSFKFLGAGHVGADHDHVGADHGGSGACHFLAGFGQSYCGWSLFGEDHPLYINGVTALRAVLGGASVEYDDALETPTAAASASWGGLKQREGGRR